MKQNITKNLISLSLLLSIFVSQAGLAIAQSASNDAFNTSGQSLYTVPSNAVVGSTDERGNAYNSLSETAKSQASVEVKQMVENATPQKKENNTINLSFVDNSGNNLIEGSSIASVEDSSDFFGQTLERRCPTCPPLASPPVDADNDGLADSFENSLADGFTPFYFVSGGEDNGTGFARFNDSVPQTVSQVFGPTPPISHYRVKPLGFFYRGNTGIQYGLIQINYHTLWNRDDGLFGSPYCVFDPIIDFISLGSHNLDNEYSAILVAAPLVNSTYDSNLQKYKLYEVYTAAHEGTFFDQSRYYNLQTPFSFGSHIKLALSRSKHATYTFNPDYIPLTPFYVINSVYAEIQYKYYNGLINYNTYLVYLFLADQTFFACGVERFQDNGGVFASTRINVGEVNQPINNSRFIQDVELSNQLNRFFY
ncbi:hypothetical protein BH20ACI4_BH20ACI4_23940 [soil metagenome]